MENTGKKYIKSHQLGNKGEAFFESLMSEHALVHKIVGSKDMGFDFLCEWVYGENPTRLLFGVQVKSSRRIIENHQHTNRLNGLEQYKLSVSVKINEQTKEYWRGFDFPIFLFVIGFKKGDPAVYYKRYTPILHQTSKEGDEGFFHVNEGSTFFAFKERSDSRTGGFCRDLYIDHLRCQYNKGMLSGVNPEDIGLKGWRKGDIYFDVANKYMEQIDRTFKAYQKFQGLD